MATIDESVSLSESVDVKSPAPFAGVDPLAGQAVKLCVACGKLLCDPYPAAKDGPKVKACHGTLVREDYAPSVRLDPERLKKGEMYAIAGEPMDHVRARAQG